MHRRQAAIDYYCCRFVASQVALNGGYEKNSRTKANPICAAGGVWHGCADAHTATVFHAMEPYPPGVKTTPGIR